MKTLVAIVAAALLSLGAPVAHAGDDPRPLAIGAPSNAPSTLEQWRALPDRLRYTPGRDVPYGYDHVRMVRRAPMIVGASVFGGTYFFSTLGATADRSLYPMLIPVVGPWISIFTAARFIEPQTAWLLTWAGIAQTTGVALFIWGAADKQDWLVKRPFGLASLNVSPAITHEQAGAVVSGRF